MASDEREGGLDAAQVAETAYKAFAHAVRLQPGGAPLPEWNALEETVQKRWMHAASFAVDCIGANEGGTIVWPEVARMTYDAFVGEMPPAMRRPFEQLLMIQQIGWQAAARHVGNVVTFESPADEDLASHELVWRGWADKRLAELVPKEQVR